MIAFDELTTTETHPSCALFDSHSPSDPSPCLRKPVGRVRRVLLVGTLAVGAMLAMPTEAHAGIFGVFGAIFSLISGPIGTALKEITTITQQTQRLYQQIVWPLAQINQARGFVSTSIHGYRNRMTSIFYLPVQSATLQGPQQLEQILHSRNTTQLTALESSFHSNYGTVPVANTTNNHDGDDRCVNIARYLRLQSRLDTRPLFQLEHGQLFHVIRVVSGESLLRRSHVDQRRLFHGTCFLVRRDRRLLCSAFVWRWVLELLLRVREGRHIAQRTASACWMLGWCRVVAAGRPVVVGLPCPCDVGRAHLASVLIAIRHSDRFHDRCLACRLLGQRQCARRLLLLLCWFGLACRVSLELSEQKEQHCGDEPAAEQHELLRVHPFLSGEVRARRKLFEALVSRSRFGRGWRCGRLRDYCRRHVLRLLRRFSSVLV